MGANRAQERDVRALLRTVAFARAHSGPLGRRIAAYLARHAYRRVMQHPPVRLLVKYDGGLFCIDTAVDSGAQRRILFQPLHALETLQVIRTVVKPGMTCLDIGANTGAHTLVMARAAGPEGWVVAVEPHPGAARCLRDNVAINRLPNVTVIEAALCRSDGRVPLYSGRDVGLASLLQLQPTAQPREVRGVSGAKLLREVALSVCDMVKIDVNGWEWVALCELKPLIERARPHLLIKHKAEHWGKAGAQVTDALAMLSELHYKVYCLLENAIWALDGPPPRYCKLFCVPAEKPSSPV